MLQNIVTNKITLKTKLVQVTKYINCECRNWIIVIPNGYSLSTFLHCYSLLSSWVELIYILTNTFLSN